MNREMEGWARSTLDAFSPEIDKFPSAYPQMLIALDFAIGPSREIVIAGEQEDSGTQKMIRTVYDRYLPNKVVALHPRESEAAKRIEALSPFIEKQTALGGKPTAYVCKNYVCDLPVTETSKLIGLLET